MVAFKELWEKHPTITGDDTPCETDGKPNFSSQCAIRMGVALVRCDVDTKKIPGVVYCWYHKKSEGHILAAQKLADGLCKATISGIGKVQKVTPADFDKKLSGKTGIIFFKDYWAREGENTNRTGDHIDLWNGSRLTDWKSWIRIKMNISWDGYWSDYKKAKEIWFWSVL